MLFKQAQQEDSGHARAQFKGNSKLNTHLCESEILQLPQMASIRCFC